MIVDPIYDNARLYRIRKETEDIKMEKKDIDWSNLSFGYQETDYSYVSNYKDGKWDDGQLTKDHTVTLNECAGVFQYAHASKDLRHTQQRMAELSASDLT